MNLESANSNLWEFSPIPNIEESNFNKILERFYGLGPAGLTRENIQNSLDGRLKEGNEPVVVTIELGEVNRNAIPGIESIVERINSLEGRNGYTKETIKHMQACMNDEVVSYISFEDSNTKGLTGAEHGQSNSKDHTWGIYAYNKGVHFEESDESFEASRGGSHGVGKIASNSASDLHLMYFSNCDEHGNQHLGGTIQLIEHNYKGQYYRSTGYFAKLEDSNGTKKFMPYENTYNSIFENKTRGLKIIIPFLRKSFDNEIEVVRAVCDSFFVSILEKKLVVKVNDLVIDHSTIKSIVKNEEYYVLNVEEMKKVFTPLYVDTYVNKEPCVIEIPIEGKVFKFNLYFSYNEDIPKGRTAIVRTIGMKIEDFAVKNNANKPYNAVLIGGAEGSSGFDEDSYLKSLENESHTKISNEDIKDPKLKKVAGKFISNLNKEILKVIEEEIRKNNPVDGKINTSDLLYTMELDFTENLTNSYGAIKIKNSKSLVSADDSHKEKGKKETKDIKKSGVKRKPGEKSEVISKPARRRIKRETYGEELSVNKRAGEFKINPSRVERLIIKDTELIQLNLSEVKEIQKAINCDLKFNVIDGMGKEYVDEFNINDNYSSIIDINNDNKPCKVTNGVIQDAQIKNGLVNLKLSLQPNYNRALKFIYCVEV